jgi:uncharacterized membrane protein
LLAFPIALSCSSVATDITYLNSAVVQWSHFSAWLIAGTALFTGLALAWAVVAYWLGRGNAAPRKRLVYVAILAAMFVLSVVNSFQHAGDAWASIGTAGLLMSIVTAVLALAAGWIAYSARVVEVVR